MSVSPVLACAIAVLSAPLATHLAAQQRDSSTAVRTSVVSGVVYDSIARAPLAEANVQLVSMDRSRASGYSAITDSAGRFTIPTVAVGEYVIGFFHPMLDSLGIDQITHRVSIRADAPTRVALAVPSPQRLHAAICGERTKNDSSGVVIGHLMDADNRTAVADGRVNVRWMELTISRNGLGRSFPTVSDTTSASGWFALCGVPLLADVTLQAARGQDSTAELTVEIPATRLLRRDLFVAPSQISVAPSPDSAQTPDSLRLPPVYMHRGSARLDGVVKRGGSNQPLRGARVTVVGSGVVATTDEGGRFALSSLPGGTQMLETRAVGYVPDHRIVDLVGGRGPTVEIKLPTIKSVLDTIRVTAKRVYSADTRGFEARRRAGFGKFFGPEEVARYRPYQTTSLLNQLPSVRTVTSGFDERILMRGLTGGYCSPTIFIDGFRLMNMDARDINNWVQPEDIEGMEVYTSANQVPAQFSSFDACGAIIIWTRAPVRRKP